MNPRAGLALLLIAMLAFVALTGCGDDDEPGVVDPDASVTATCEGCHTDQAKLQATALPDPPPPEDEGEG